MQRERTYPAADLLRVLVVMRAQYSGDSLRLASEFLIDDDISQYQYMRSRMETRPTSFAFLTAVLKTSSTSDLVLTRRSVNVVRCCPSGNSYKEAHRIRPTAERNVPGTTRSAWLL
jgi:hypothetical protein